MVPTAPQQTLPPSARWPVIAMYAGLVLTVIAMVVPVIDQANADVLSRHIQDTYPNYTADRINSDKSVILSYLFSIGAIGVVSWLWMIRTVKKQKHWARIGATIVFLLATGDALLNLLLEEHPGAKTLPTMLGVTSILPCVAGLVAVAFLWKRDRIITPTQ